MRRLGFVALLLAMIGCGVEVKPQATDKAKPPAPVAAEPEVYDKVAPMPRAVEGEKKNP